jgi:hypothetical protein
MNCLVNRCRFIKAIKIRTRYSNNRFNDPATHFVRERYHWNRTDHFLRVNHRLNGTVSRSIGTTRARPSAPSSVSAAPEIRPTRPVRARFRTGPDRVRLPRRPSSSPAV